MTEKVPEYRGVTWRGHPPWPLNLLERIVIWPDGCWSLERANGGAPEEPLRVPPVIRNEETGVQEQAYKAIWRLLGGPEPPRRGRHLTRGLYATACGNQWCVNPGHRELLPHAEGARRVKIAQGGRDHYDTCTHGHSRAEFGYRTPAGKLRCRACATATRKAYRVAHPEKERAAVDRQLAKRRALSQARREADAIIEGARLLQQPPG